MKNRIGLLPSGQSHGQTLPTSCPLPLGPSLEGLGSLGSLSSVQCPKINPQKKALAYRESLGDMITGRNFDLDFQEYSEKCAPVPHEASPCTPSPRPTPRCHHPQSSSAHRARGLLLLVLLKRWAQLPLTFLLGPSLFIRSSSHHIICSMSCNMSPEPRLCFSMSYILWAT